MFSRFVGGAASVTLALSIWGCSGRGNGGLFAPEGPSDGGDAGPGEGGLDGLDGTGGGGDTDPSCASTCSSPPPNACSDAKTLRAYVPKGTCAGSACTYARYDVLCAVACQVGACTGDDPCNGVTCVAPPRATCVNATTLKSYSAAGTCSAGACSYVSTNTACSKGCQAGACKGDPCAGVTCNQPPAPACLDATSRRSYAPVGSCGGGACSYAPSDSVCPVPANAAPSCANGTCDFACRTGYQRAGAGCVAVAAQGTWATLTSLTTARGRLAAASSGGKIYALGGDGGGGDLTTAEAYTPSTNAWSPVASMPTARTFIAAATGADGRIYTLGGSPALATVEVYTPSTNAWVTGPSMAVGRYGLAAATGLDGRIYALGGWGTTAVANVEAYAPGASAWTAVASMPTPRYDLGAATGADGRIYALGGFGPVSQAMGLATVEAYTPSTNTWVTLAPMPTGRGHVAAAASPDGRIYAIGGDNGAASFATVEVYTPSTNTWATSVSMPTARGSLGLATGPDGRLYAVGGYNPGNGVYVSAVEAYTP